MNNLTELYTFQTAIKNYQIKVEPFTVVKAQSFVRAFGILVYNSSFQSCMNYTPIKALHVTAV